MSAVNIVVLLATLTTCHAHCTGGQVPAGARIIFQATRVVAHVGTARVICSYNLCKQLNINIVRVDISGANWSCRAGGPGGFMVEINLDGGDTRNFTATLWATGKDMNAVEDPSNAFGWSCILESRYTHCE